MRLLPPSDWFTSPIVRWLVASNLFCAPLFYFSKKTRKYEEIRQFSHDHKVSRKKNKIGGYVKEFQNNLRESNLSDKKEKRKCNFLFLLKSPSMSSTGIELKIAENRDITCSLPPTVSSMSVSTSQGVAICNGK